MSRTRAYFVRRFSTLVPPNATRGNKEPGVSCVSKAFRVPSSTPPRGLSPAHVIVWNEELRSLVAWFGSGPSSPIKWDEFGRASGGERKSSVPPCPGLSFLAAGSCSPLPPAVVKKIAVFTTHHPDRSRDRLIREKNVLLGEACCSTSLFFFEVKKGPVYHLTFFAFEPPSWTPTAAIYDAFSGVPSCPLVDCRAAKKNY